MLRKSNTYHFIDIILSLISIYLLPIILTIRFHQSISLNTILGLILGLIMLSFPYLKQRLTWLAAILSLGIICYIFFTLSKPLALIFLSILILMFSLQRSLPTSQIFKSTQLLMYFLYSLALVILQIHLVSKAILIPLIFPFFTLFFFTMLSELNNRWLIIALLILLNLYLFINYLNWFQIVLYIVVTTLLVLSYKSQVKLPQSIFLVLLLIIAVI